VIHKSEVKLIEDRLNDDAPLTPEEEITLLRLSRQIVNRIRYNHPIEDHVHNACAGVWHVMDWPWNEIMRSKR
jgi:hypothetical protein